MPVDSAVPILIGREEELSRLRAAIAQAAEGNGQILLLEGAGGMGKTSLATASEQMARDAGFCVAWGHCWEAVDAPAFWSWSQVISRLHAEYGWEDVAPWVAAELLGLIDPESSDTPVPSDSARFALFRAVVFFLRTRTQEQPVLIVLEDLHAADEPTLRLLQMLSTELRHDRILILGTIDSSAARGRSLHDQLVAQLSLGQARIALRRLDESKIAELFGHVSGREPQPSIAAAIASISEGNPFFVLEAIRLLTATGTLHRPDHSVGFRVPEGARALLGARIEALDDRTKELLEVAAVLGRRFKLSILADVTDIPLDPLLEILEDALVNDVIEEAGVDEYRFTHIMLRETVYEGLKAGTRMRLHRQVAEVLERGSEEEVDASRTELAHHWFKAAQSGDPTRAIAHTEAAARQAMANKAYEEAARLYNRGLKVAESVRGLRDERERLATGYEQATALASGSRSEAPRATEDARFERCGDFWIVEFGGKTAQLRNSKGIGYLAVLLGNPGREIHSVELVRGAVGEPASTSGDAREDLLTSSPPDDLGPLLDAQAKAELRRRVEELRSEIEEANSFNDPERAARYQAELDAVVEHVARATGIGGRDRKAGSISERARVNAAKNLKDALQRVAEALPAAGEHLKATVKTGVFCSYTPDPRAPIEWRM